MNMKLGKWWLGATLALVGSTITPAMADDWNKETRLQVNEPVQIPGKVLMPGKYIFKLVDGESNRKTVEVFSVDTDGRQKFVTFVLAISAYKMDTPDKATIGLEERPSGSPQAIHNWFYPGDNYGWEFVYPKSERLQVSAVQAPVEQPEPVAADLPALPDPPAETVQEPPAEPEVVEEGVVETEATLILIPDKTEDSDGSAERMLPETASYSMMELAAGVAMLGFGLLTVFVGRRRAEA